MEINMTEKEKAKAAAYMKKAAPRGETRDCTVRAIAAALDIPYWKAHKLCAQYGRTPRSGFNFMCILKRKGTGRKPKVFHGHRVSFRKCPHKTVRSFMKSHPTGTYILSVYRHACTLKDGVMIGLHESQFGQHIKYYLYVSKKQKKEVTIEQQVAA